MGRVLILLPLATCVHWMGEFLWYLPVIKALETIISVREKKADAPELEAMRKEKTESVMEKRTHQKKSPRQMRIHAEFEVFRGRPEHKTRTISALEMDGYYRCCCENSARVTISMPNGSRVEEEKENRYAGTSCKKILSFTSSRSRP